MSKAAHRHKPVHKPIRPKHTASDSKLNRYKPILILVLILVLAGIPFSLGKYFEFNTPDAFDSGAYIYSAKHILDGARIGIDEKPSAQMGTLLMNMLGVRLFGFNETGPTLIQMFLQACALFIMFVVMVKLFGILPAAVGVTIASIYLSAPLIAKYGNVKEQYMIAFMILGVCCYLLRQLDNKWWYALMAGLFLSWAPMFKETGVSAIGAVGIFIIAQPLLKNSTWRKTGVDISLMLAGAAIILCPIYLWLAVQKTPAKFYPYSSLTKPIIRAFQRPDDSMAEPSQTDTEAEDVQNNKVKPGFFLKIMPSYVRDSWQIFTPEQIKQARLRVFRWYRLLILPIVLALSSIIVGIIKLIKNRRSKSPDIQKTTYDRFVLLFAVWWILDMSFVWISPRSYEQYYLPLNASAAMLGGYTIAVYNDKLKRTIYKPQWSLIGFAGLIAMIVMSWHIFFGINKSPHSGQAYQNPSRQRGYVQKLNEISMRKKGNYKGSWEVAGEYIKQNSEPDDGIYVWGWVPGIYVVAQRMSPTPKAFEGTMHTLDPVVLSERVTEILNAFEKKSPEFIVDSRKSHFPWDRPPLELWPFVGQESPFSDERGFLSTDEQKIRDFNQSYTILLRQKIEPAEARRFEAMEPFREYVMTNYTIVRPFGQHILFQHK